LFLELAAGSPAPSDPPGLPLGVALSPIQAAALSRRMTPQGLGSVSRGRGCPSLSTLPLVAAFPPLYEEVLRGYEAAAGRYAVPSRAVRVGLLITGPLSGLLAKESRRTPFCKTMGSHLAMPHFMW